MRTEILNQQGTSKAKRTMLCRYNRPLTARVLTSSAQWHNRYSRCRVADVGIFNSVCDLINYN